MSDSARRRLPAPEGTAFSIQEEKELTATDYEMCPPNHRCASRPELPESPVILSVFLAVYSQVEGDLPVGRGKWRGGIAGVLSVGNGEEPLGRRTRRSLTTGGACP
jgi:hypothetical protein